MNREVPVDFLKGLNPKQLPLGVGHNWEDPAFRPRHAKEHIISNEHIGKRRVVVAPSGRSTKDSTSGSDVASLLDSVTAASAHQLVHSLRAAEEGRSEELSRATLLTLEDKVLRFNAYLSEHVRESALESVRHRLVTITYFPHDDSILIQEPHLPNSGLQGGTLLKRQRVPADARQREALPQHDHLCLDHIQVGSDLVVYGTTYSVYACDDATRRFLNEMGQTVPPNGRVPQDNYAKRLQASETFSSGSYFGVKSQDRAVDDVIRTQRFIQDSGKVLLFHALNDERAEGGHVRNMDVLLFIEDDTMSITERQNSSEAVPSSFLSRRRLPKDGKMEKTVELSFAHRVNGMRETNLGSPDAYYSPLDLNIGVVINVFGRSVFLYDADDFTKEYYEQQYGVTLHPPVDVSTVTARAAAFTKANRPSLPLPPYTGFGTYEDSLSSCKSLALKPPRGNLLDPHSKLDVLRFQMRLHNPERLEDRGRIFTLNYYVEDGEMLVAETAVKNSGFTGGKFCRKQRLVKSFDGVKPVFYTLNDLTVGAVLDINKFKFEIVTCDLHTENHLAHPKSQGVPPDVAAKVTKARLVELLAALRGFLTVRYVTQTEAFRSFDRDRDGVITLDEMHNGLKAHLITSSLEEAVALFHQIATSPTSISHNDFFQWLANPPTVAMQQADAFDTTVTSSNLVAASAAGAKTHARNAVLRRLKEKLEARCLNGFEMFRMSSTMPRAYKGRRADIQCLANADKDSVISPVQLHRCVDEVLGLSFTDAEISLLLEFFFPDVPVSDRYRKSDVGTSNARVDLKTFQERFIEMSQVDQLQASA